MARAIQKWNIISSTRDIERERGRRDVKRQRKRERMRGQKRERTFHRVDSRDDSPRLVKPSGGADIEFMVTMETGPEGTTFVRFIPYSRGYVINAVPMSSLTSPLTYALRPCIAVDVEIDIFLNFLFSKSIDFPI